MNLATRKIYSAPVKNSNHSSFKWLLLVGVGCFMLSATPPSKTFAAERFDFTKYCDPQKMKVALREAFPRGTARKSVEESLLSGGATVQADEPSRGKVNYFSYFREVVCSPEDSRWRVNVTYDRNDKVRQISATGVNAVFPESPPEDRADASIFSFNDYSDADDLLQTLKILFPKGTPRTQVETVLIRWNLARRLIDPNEPQVIYYRHSYDAPTVKNGKRGSEERVWDVSVSYFKDDNTVSGITLDGSPLKRAFSTEESREYYLRYKKKFKKRKQ